MKQFILPFEPAVNSGKTLKYPLEGKAFHYLIHVRRYRLGDTILAVTPTMSRFIMVIESIEKNHCMVELQQEEDTGYALEQPGLDITLMPAILKGKKMDLVIRQAVEAGVSNVWPVLTEHSVVHYRNKDDSHIKTERWKRIAIEAMQQCGGQYSTSIAPTENLDTVLKKWNGQNRMLFLHEKNVESNMDLHHCIAGTNGELAIITGPEGGLSNAEVRLLEKAGAFGMHLGNRILRAETAVLYILAAVLTIAREREQWNPVRHE